MYRRRTIINGVFIKIRVESGVIIFIVGVVRLEWVLGELEVRIFAFNKRNRGVNYGMRRSQGL